MTRTNLLFWCKMGRCCRYSRAVRGRHERL